MAYHNFSNCRNFINSSCNVLLQHCKPMAKQCTLQNSYIERCNLLKTVFDKVSGITDIILIDNRCYVLHMVSKSLNNFPSATEHISGSNKKCLNKTNSSPSIT